MGKTSDAVLLYFYIKSFNIFKKIIFTFNNLSRQTDIIDYLTECYYKTQDEM